MLQISQELESSGNKRRRYSDMSTASSLVTSIHQALTMATSNFQRRKTDYIWILLMFILCYFAGSVTVLRVRIPFSHWSSVVGHALRPSQSTPAERAELRNFMDIFDVRNPILIQVSLHGGRASNNRADCVFLHHSRQHEYCLHFQFVYSSCVCQLV